MDSPYKTRLKKLVGKEFVTIHRIGLPNITGELTKTDEDGCIMTQKGDGFHKGRLDEEVHEIFIAYGDIHGVESVEWDYKNL